MTMIKATPAELRSVASKISASSSSIASETQVLKGQVDNLDFEGRGSTAFRARYDEWQAAAVKLQQALQEISQGLGQTAAYLEDSDNSVAGAWNKG